jgi:hypothetical protein
VTVTAYYVGKQGIEGHLRPRILCVGSGAAFEVEGLAVSGADRVTARIDGADDLLGFKSCGQREWPCERCA